MMTIIISIFVQNMLKFYFPFFIEKRLKKLRYSPRISADGNIMKLLSEEEEDVYLDEGMRQRKMLIQWIMMFGLMKKLSHKN